MLKHASPQRSVSSLANPLQGFPAGNRPSNHAHPHTHLDIPSGSIPTGVAPPGGVSTGGHTTSPGSRPTDVALRDSYSEISVDCESLIVPSAYALAEKEAGYQVGTWSGVAQANVRRGLSFSSRRAPDSISFRSVRSEGPPASHVTSTPPTAPKTSSSCSNVMDVSTWQKDPVNFKAELAEQKSIIQYTKGDITSLKNLLRLPGVRGHARIVEVSKAGVPLSPDSLSLNSSDGFFSVNSGRTSSRSWSSNASSNSNGTNTSTSSNSSTSEPTSTTIKIFAKCLRSDIEYKTISVSSRATCKEVVSLLLSKYRMRHRDPNLFYLTMEVTVRRWSGMPVRSLLVLEDGARPAQLALCRPPGDSRFSLQMRRGGVIKVHDTVLMPGSQYKSLLVSDRTNAEEVVQLLLHCYNRQENKYYYALHEVRRSPDYSDRILLPEEKPLEVKSKWPRDRQAEFVFVLRRNMSHALSLRRLSLRTGEVKRPPPSILENGKPLVITETMPVKGILKTSVSKTLSIEESGSLIDEEAVIDCTGVTPKMTTINRKGKSPSGNTLDVQVHSNGTSCSSGPTVTFSKTVSMSSCPYSSGRSNSDGTLNVKVFQLGLSNQDLKGSPTGSLCTVDSATNTEVKSWSNTSTQTVVSSTLRKTLSAIQKEDQHEKIKVTCQVSNPEVCFGDLRCSKSLSEFASSQHTAAHIDSDVKHVCKQNCSHCFYI